VTPERRPSRRRRIQQIVFCDSRWSASEVSFNLWEDRAQKIKSFTPALFGLLAVLHGTLLVQRPKTDFGVNLKCPFLAVGRDCIVHLLDLGADAIRLLAQTPLRSLSIDLIRLRMGGRE
jgi:hypothetical protein